MSYRLGTTILLMISMQDKQHIQSLSDDRMRSNLLIPIVIKHCQEVLHISQFIIRLVEISPNSEPIRVSTDSRHGAYNSENLLIDQSL